MLFVADAAAVGIGPLSAVASLSASHRLIGSAAADGLALSYALENTPVSYTHLTLPTKA